MWRTHVCTCTSGACVRRFNPLLLLIICVRQLCAKFNKRCAQFAGTEWRNCRTKSKMMWSAVSAYVRSLIFDVQVSGDKECRCWNVAVINIRYCCGLLIGVWWIFVWLCAFCVWVKFFVLLFSWEHFLGLFWWSLKCKRIGKKGCKIRRSKLECYWRNIFFLTFERALGCRNGNQ